MAKKKLYEQSIEAAEMLEDATADMPMNSTKTTTYKLTKEQSEEYKNLKTPKEREAYLKKLEAAQSGGSSAPQPDGSPQTAQAAPLTQEGITEKQEKLKTLPKDSAEAKQLRQELLQDAAAGGDTDAAARLQKLLNGEPTYGQTAIAAEKQTEAGNAHAQSIADAAMAEAALPGAVVENAPPPSAREAARQAGLAEEEAAKGALPGGGKDGKGGKPGLLDGVEGGEKVYGKPYGKKGHRMYHGEKLNTGDGGFWSKLGNGLLDIGGGLVNMAGDMALGAGAGSYTVDVHQRQRAGTLLPDLPDYPDYQKMTADELAKAVGSGRAVVAPGAKPVTDGAVPKEELVEVGGAYYRKEDLRKAGEENRFSSDAPRAAATDAFTRGIRDMPEIADRIKAAEKDMEGKTPAERDKYIQSVINNSKIKVAGLPNIKENALLQAIKEKYPDEEFTVRELNALINTQNAMMGVKGKSDLGEVYEAVVNKNGKLKDENGEDIEDIDKWLEKRYAEDGPGKGANTYARRGIGGFDAAAAPAPEAPPPAAPKKPYREYDIYGARALGLFGNTPQAAAVAGEMGRQMGVAAQQRALYEQARGLSTQQDAFNLRQSGNEIIEQNKNLSPAQQQAALAKWKNGILTNAQYSPNAPGLTPEQRIERTHMLQQTFNQTAAAMQRGCRISILNRIYIRNSERNSHGIE